MTAVQLALPLVLDDGDEWGTEDNDTLIVIAGQTRRRMWGRRAAVATLHSRTGAPLRRDGRDGLTDGQRSALDRLDDAMTALAHLDPYDREDR